MSAEWPSSSNLIWNQWPQRRRASHCLRSPQRKCPPRRARIWGPRHPSRGVEWNDSRLGSENSHAWKGSVPRRAAPRWLRRALALLVARILALPLRGHLSHERAMHKIHVISRHCLDLTSPRRGLFRRRFPLAATYWIQGPLASRLCENTKRIRQSSSPLVSPLRYLESYRSTSVSHHPRRLKRTR